MRRRRRRITSISAGRTGETESSCTISALSTTAELPKLITSSCTERWIVTSLKVKASVKKFESQKLENGKRGVATAGRAFPNPLNRTVFTLRCCRRSYAITNLHRNGSDSPCRSAFTIGSWSPRIANCGPKAARGTKSSKWTCSRSSSPSSGIKKVFWKQSPLSLSPSSSHSKPLTG